MVTPKLKHVSITLDDIIESNYRLEAQVFNIDAIQAKEQLAACRWDIRTVGGPDGLATAYHRPRFKRIYVERSHYPIFQPSQITEIYPKPLLYISDKTDTDIAALRVKKGQILMTCSGTVGKCTIVSDTLDNHIFSHDLLRITANRFEDTGYLYAFFISKMGQLLLTTSNYGAVIQHIEPEHLDAVPVPVPPEPIRDAIHALIMESFALREESNRLIDEAERLLVEALQLPPLATVEQAAEQYDGDQPFRNFNVKLDLLSDRFDASYHVPIGGEILDRVFDSGARVLPLRDETLTRQVLHPPRFKRIYVDEGEGVPFFGGRSLYELVPSGMKYISLAQHRDLVDSLLRVHKNSILITRSGTIGKTVFVPRHWDGWVATDDLIRVIPKDDDIAGYLFTWLNSDYGRTLLERMVYGSVVDHIEEFHVSQMPVPVLPDTEIQRRINDLAVQANERRAEAYDREQEALEKLEGLFDE